MSCLKAKTSRSIFFRISMCTVFCLSVFLASPVFSDWGGDIDDVAGELDKDFQFGSKEDIKRDNIEQANTQLKEDNQILLEKMATTLSPLSGNWDTSVNSTFTFVYTVFESGQLSAIGTSTVVPTVTIKIVGSITGNTSQFTVTRSETTGAPTNFSQDCTESTTVTGLISGSGAPGSTHTFTRSPLCSEMNAVTVLHTKLI